VKYIYWNPRYPRFFNNSYIFCDQLMVAIKIIFQRQSLIYYLEVLSFDSSPQLLNPNINNVLFDTGSELMLSNDVLIDSSNMEGSDTDII